MPKAQMLGVEKNRSPNIIVPFYIKIIMHMHTYRYAYTGINTYRRPKSSWKNSYRIQESNTILKTWLNQLTMLVPKSLQKLNRMCVISVLKKFIENLNKSLFQCKNFFYNHLTECMYVAHSIIQLSQISIIYSWIASLLKNGKFVIKPKLYPRKKVYTYQDTM